MTKTMLKKKQAAKPAPKPRPVPRPTPKTTPKPAPALKEAPAPDLILFGIPSGARRAVGARFPAEEAGVAHWIARHQGLSVAAAGTEALAQFTARMPEWRLRPDDTRGGRAGVPSGAATRASAPVAAPGMVAEPAA